MNPLPNHPLAAEIPPSAVVRRRLAAAATEMHLLRQLLKLAVRRECEVARLARLAGAEPGEVPCAS